MADCFCRAINEEPQWPLVHYYKGKTQTVAWQKGIPNIILGIIFWVFTIVQLL